MLIFSENHANWWKQKLTDRSWATEIHQKSNRNPTEIHLQLTAGKGAANSFKSIGKGVRKGACWWGMLVLETVLKGGQGFQTRSKESINGSTKNSTSFGKPQKARPWVLSTHGRWTPPSLLWWVESTVNNPGCPCHHIGYGISPLSRWGWSPCWWCWSLPPAWSVTTPMSGSNNKIQYY